MSPSVCKAVSGAREGLAILLKACASLLHSGTFSAQPWSTFEFSCPNHALSGGWTCSWHLHWLSVLGNAVTQWRLPQRRQGPSIPARSPWLLWPGLWQPWAPLFARPGWAWVGTVKDSGCDVLLNVHKSGILWSLKMFYKNTRVHLGSNVISTSWTTPLQGKKEISLL